MQLHEALTESFYAWEIRGRGWHAGRVPVQLEPPHRPFFLLPEYVTQFTKRNNDDDGVVPSLWQRIFEKKETPKPPKPYEEQLPFARTFPYEPVTFSLFIPEGYTASVAETAALLRTLAGAFETISFEMVGTRNAVRLAVTCHTVDREHVRTTLEAFLPDGSVEESSDVLAEHWDTENTRAHIDYGLMHEFFLPLHRVKNFSIDPSHALCAALSRAGDGESLCFQVLIERTINPWPNTIMDAVTGEDGSCFFADAPECVSYAKIKTETPLFAASLRLGASADSRARIEQLLSGFDGVFNHYSDVNELIPLEAFFFEPGEEGQLLTSRTSLRTGMLLSLDELVGLVHIPSAPIRSLVREQAHVPDATDDAIILGTINHYGEVLPIPLEASARFAHTHIIGASGTGKSVQLLSMIMQDIEHGDGVCVIDPHGDLVDDILACIPEYRSNDVIVFDPSDTEYPLGLNVLYAASVHEKTLLASDLVSTIARLSTSWGDVMSTVLAEAVLALLETDTPYSLLDLRRFLSDGAFRKKCLAPITDETILNFWHKDFAHTGTKSIGPLVSRLDAFLRLKVMRNILGQRTGGIQFGDVMNERKILLARLPLGLMGANNAQLLGSLLVTKCQQYAVARQAMPKHTRKPFFLYIDECQHFVTPSLASIFGEARKYKLGLTLAHQYLSQMKGVPEVAAALEGAHTRIVFRPSGGDARSLAQNFSLFDHDDISSLVRGEALVRIGNMGNEARIQTLYSEVPYAPEQHDKLREQSRIRYGTKAQTIEAQFREWYAAAETKPQEPAVTVTQPHPKEILERTLLPPELKPRTKQKPVIEPLEQGRGGAEHKYLQHLIKRLAEERGCRAVIEESVPSGKVDIALYRETIKVACEVSITTDIEHELQNISKCLATSMFTHVICVVQKARMRERLHAAVQKQNPAIPVSVIDAQAVHAVLDEIFPIQVPAASVVKGYKVNLKRGSGTPEHDQAMIAKIIARSVKRGA